MTLPRCTKTPTAGPRRGQRCDRTAREGDPDGFCRACRQGVDKRARLDPEIKREQDRRSKRRCRGAVAHPCRACGALRLGRMAADGRCPNCRPGGGDSLALERHERCVVGTCQARRIDGAPWCAGHRPRFGAAPRVGSAITDERAQARCCSPTEGL